MIEKEKRGLFANETYKKSTALSVKVGRFKDALALLKRQNTVLLTIMDTFEADLYKNFLCATVIYFRMEDYKGAEANHQENESVASYSGSDEWEAAVGMLDALTAGSQEALKGVVLGKRCFKNLPTQVTRLARKLELSAEAQDVGDGDSGGESDGDDGVIDLS